MNSPKILCAAGAACALAAAPLPPARAQLGTGTVTWEANDGSGWTSGRLVTTAPTVEVRMRAGWSADFGFGLAGIQFDAVVTSPAEAIDAVSGAARLGVFTGGNTQTLAASRFGNQIKIDDSRDTLPPGIGARGVFPGQSPANFGWPPHDPSNPAFVFSFRLTFDAVAGARTINSLYIAPSSGDTISRYMRVYTTGGGAQNTPNTSTIPLEIFFIPAPGTMALAAAALLITRRRR